MPSREVRPTPAHSNERPAAEPTCDSGPASGRTAACAGICHCRDRAPSARAVVNLRLFTEVGLDDRPRFRRCGAAQIMHESPCTVTGIHPQNPCRSTRSCQILIAFRSRSNSSAISSRVRFAQLLAGPQPGFLPKKPVITPLWPVLNRQPSER